MILVSPKYLDHFWLEETIWIAESKIKIPAYDFNFENFFACRRPLYRSENITAVGRFGVTENYAGLFENLQNKGISLIHTPVQYQLASELTHWYPLIEDLTPRSLWFDEPPPASEIERDFDYPVFLKGSRQTSRHKAELSIINSREEYENSITQYKQNPILSWQKIVVREFIKLRKVEGRQTDKIPASFEFRSFWWKRNLAGAGAYWKDFASYNWTESEKREALQVASQAVKRLNLPFVVIDLAQTEKGDWIVIECNDGQESGYTDVSPISLWQNIIELERRNQK